jgi:farnesyl diphosphate synthase
VGTDIQDNKCSWLVVQALDRATPAQRKALEAHYGKHDASSVRACVRACICIFQQPGRSVDFVKNHAINQTGVFWAHSIPPSLHPSIDPSQQVEAVKALYNEMGLEGVFKQYEEESYKEICRELDALPKTLPRPVFEILLKKIYKRSK